MTAVQGHRPVAADALATLQQWSAPDPTQQRLRDDFVAHLLRHPDGERRDCLPDHVTASALVLSTDGHALLTLHAKVGRWLQFGGHIDPTDATLGGAALREAAEESGLPDLQLASSQPLQLDRHPAPCSPRARHHLDVQYLVTVDGLPTPVVSPESHDVRWWPVDDLPADADQAVRRLVSRAVAARR